MTCKNISKKIIGIGTTPLMPGESANLPEDFQNNPTIEWMISMGFLERVDDCKGTNTTISALKNMKRQQLVVLCGEYGIEVSENDTAKTLKAKIASFISGDDAE